MPPPAQIAALAWYRRNDYEELLALFVDRDRLPATYDDWRRRFEIGEQHAKRLGQTVARVLLRPRPFAAWCTARGLAPDAIARNRFIAEEANRLYRQQ